MMQLVWDNQGLALMQGSILHSAPAHREALVLLRVVDMLITSTAVLALVIDHTSFRHYYI